MKNSHVSFLGSLPVRIGILGGKSAVVAMTGMGTAASAATLSLIHRYAPRYVLLEGIAGGLRKAKVSLGDIIVAERFYDLDFGKLDKGKFTRWCDNDGWPDPEMLGLARVFSLRDSRNWLQHHVMSRPDRKSVRAIRVHFGSIASSNKIIDDPHSPFGKRILTIPNDVMAVEMEATALAAAIRLEQSRQLIGLLVVRCISDIYGGRGSSNGSAQRDRWRTYAASSAAAFTEALVHSFPTDPVKIAGGERP